MVAVDEDRKQTVPRVQEAVYDAPGSEDEILSQSKLIGQIEEHAVLVIDEDTEQSVVAKVEELPLLYEQSGGAQGKTTPKIFARCGESSCQFSMELEDEVSALRVLRNHIFVAHKRQEQDHQQKLFE